MKNLHWRLHSHLTDSSASVYHQLRNQMPSRFSGDRDSILPSKLDHHLNNQLRDQLGRQLSWQIGIHLSTI